MPPGSEPLHLRLERTLAGDGEGLDALAAAEPLDARDAALTLLAVHDLHLAPIDRVGDRLRWQHHPAVAAVKMRLEDRFLERLGAPDASPANGRETVAAVRALAARDAVPAVYRWAAETAGRDELYTFLALEGGPDGGFDDLVAVCQVGLDGAPKRELANNYWDEMGRGEAAAVHTELHRRFALAIATPAPPRTDQPVEALERTLLNSVLATNRRLQPEMVGALGLVELQAGPRCRRVVDGLRRVGAPDDALAFYVEHAVADPRHGKDWLDKIVHPLAADPRWAAGIVRGARWRSEVNRRFFAVMEDRLPRSAPHRAA